MSTTDRGPCFVGFASQKGGVGKSSLAEILAAILYYEQGVNLLVVDCDGTQESFFKLRERERQLTENDPRIAGHLNRFFQQLGRPAYRIIRSSPARAIADTRAVLSGQEDAALVIFDFPGHAGTKTLLELSVEMDYIISPIETDVQSLTSSIAYATTIREVGIAMADARIQDFLLLWNKVDRRASTQIIDLYSQHFLQLSLSLFTSRIYASVRISHELAEKGVRGGFRSSYLPAPPLLRRGLGIDEWVEEFIHLTGIKEQMV